MPPPEPAGRVARGERPRSRRLALHGAALVVVLVLGALLGRPGIGYSSDEAAALLQAQLRADTGRWLYVHPLAAIDPEDEARPFVRGDTGTEGLAPYAKHPLYPLVLQGSEAVAGGAGPLALSVAGTALAALGAALLARRFGDGLDVPTLWVVGVGSPLLFDGWLVLAHSAAAATTAGAVLLVLRWLDPPSGRPRWPVAVATLLGITALVAVGAMLRTEALFVGPALAVAVVVAAAVGMRAQRAGVGAGGRRGVVDHAAVDDVVDEHAAVDEGGVTVTVTATATGTARSGMGAAGDAPVGVAAWAALVVPPAAAAVLGTVVAWTVDRLAERAIVGTPVPQPGLVLSQPPSFLAGRAEGLVATWLDPSYHGARSDDLVVLGLLALVTGAVLWRRHLVGAGAAAFGAGALLYAAGAATAPSGAVPGLLVAFPLLVVGAALADRRVVATAARQVVVLTAVAIALGVLATQYHYGGGVEWGGRFFAIAVPLAAPAVVAAVVNAARDLGWRRPAVRVGIVALAAVAGVLALVAVDAQRSVHGAAWAVLDEVRVAAEQSGPTASPTGRPVVVGDNRLLPQLLHPGFDEVDWVVPRAADLSRYLDRLPGAGVDRAVLVAADAESVLDGAEGWELVEGQPADGLDVVVIEHRG